MHLLRERSGRVPSQIQPMQPRSSTKASERGRREEEDRATAAKWSSARTRDRTGKSTIARARACPQTLSPHKGCECHVPRALQPTQHTETIKQSLREVQRENHTLSDVEKRVCCLTHNTQEGILLGCSGGRRGRLLGAERACQRADRCGATCSSTTEQGRAEEIGHLSSTEKRENSQVSEVLTGCIPHSRQPHENVSEIDKNSREQDHVVLREKVRLRWVGEETVRLTYMLDV